MTNRWFRFYNEALNDPKVQFLSGDMFKAWVNILCLSSMYDGVVKIEIIPFYLRQDEESCLKTIDELVTKNLLVFSKDKKTVTPNAWHARQYISDNGKERVKRHREKRKSLGLPSQNWINKKTRKEVYERDNNTCVYCSSVEDLTLDHKMPESRGGSNDISNLQTTCRACNAQKRDLTDDEYRSRNGLVTLHVTSPDYRTEQNRTEIDKDGFQDFWNLFPSQRKGNREKAEAAYRQALKRATHDEIFTGLKSYLDSDEVRRGFAKGATAWLNDDRWKYKYSGGEVRKPSAEVRAGARQA